MTERELQMKYMILEDSYRLLEERVSKLEVDLSLKNMLGVQEKLKNTSISLFLLRKDRERLANDLGLDVAEYQSSKSLGESAFEELLYNNQDAINEFLGCVSNDDLGMPVKDMPNTDIQSSLGTGAVETTIVPPVMNSQNIVQHTRDELLEDRINKAIESSNDSVSNVQNTSLEQTVSQFVPMSIDMGVDKDKKPSKRGRKSKAEREREEQEKLKTTTTGDVSNEDTKNDNAEEPKTEFEDLDAALNMWS